MWCFDEHLVKCFDMPRERKPRLGHRDACAKHCSGFLHRGPKRYAIAIPYVPTSRKIIEQLAHKRPVQNGGRHQRGFDDDVRDDPVGYEAGLLDE
jgi:hypothetical protein